MAGSNYNKAEYVGASNSLDKWLSVLYELYGCGFESRCSQSFATIKRKEQIYQCVRFI